MKDVGQEKGGRGKKSRQAGLEIGLGKTIPEPEDKRREGRVRGFQVRKAGRRSLVPFNGKRGRGELGATKVGESLYNFTISKKKKKGKPLQRRKRGWDPLYSSRGGGKGGEEKKGKKLISLQQKKKRREKIACPSPLEKEKGTILAPKRRKRGGKKGKLRSGFSGGGSSRCVKGKRTDVKDSTDEPEKAEKEDCTPLGGLPWLGRKKRQPGREKRKEEGSTEGHSMDGGKGGKLFPRLEKVQCHLGKKREGGGVLGLPEKGKGKKSSSSESKGKSQVIVQSKEKEEGQSAVEGMERGEGGRKTVNSSYFPPRGTWWKGGEKGG